MARRNEGIFEMLIDAPWWVGVITASVLYAMLRYLAPALAGDSPMSAPLGEVARIFALPVAGLALLASAYSAVRSLIARARDGVQGSAAPSGSRTCPHCGSALVVRRASRGARAGSNFWGCSSYPKCRYTEDITA
jgi:restriction system protein